MYMPAVPGVSPLRVIRIHLADWSLSSARRRVPLAAVVSCLGDSPAAFAARVDEPGFDPEKLWKWPASQEAAEEAIDREARRILEADGLGTAADFLRGALLPHLRDNEARLNSLAHAVSILLQGGVDDLDHLSNKRFDAAGDMVAAHAVHVLSELHRGLTSSIAEAALPVHHSRSAETTDIGAVVLSAVTSVLDAAFSEANAAMLNAFIRDSWVGADGSPLWGACVPVKRLNLSNAITLMRRTWSNLGEGGARKKVRSLGSVFYLQFLVFRSHHSYPFFQ